MEDKKNCEFQECKKEAIFGIIGTNNKTKYYCKNHFWKIVMNYEKL